MKIFCDYKTKRNELLKELARSGVPIEKLEAKFELAEYFHSLLSSDQYDNGFLDSSDFITLRQLGDLLLLSGTSFLYGIAAFTSEGADSFSQFRWYNIISREWAQTLLPKLEDLFLVGLPFYMVGQDSDMVQAKEEDMPELKAFLLSLASFDTQLNPEAPWLNESYLKTSDLKVFNQLSAFLNDPWGNGPGYEYVMQEAMKGRIPGISAECSEPVDRIERPLSEAIQDLKPSDPYHAPELAIAFELWESTKQNFNSKRSVRGQMKDWLESHHPGLSSSAQERIISVANWNKTGGSPASS